MSEQKKYASLSTLSTFLDNLKSTFAKLTHTHSLSDLTDYTVDGTLSSSSTNPVQNKVLDAEFDAIATSMNALESAIDTKADASHAHSISEVSDLQTTIDTMQEDITTAITNGVPVVTGTVSSDGGTITGTCDSITELYNGLTIILFPTYSTYGEQIYLNINDLGSYVVRRKISSSGSALVDGNTYYFFQRERPAILSFTGYIWLAMDMAQPDARDLYMQVPVSSGGTGLSSVTKGNYLVGLGESYMQEQTPEEVRVAIGAASVDDGVPRVPMTSDDGVTWTATIDGVTELKAGMAYFFIPDRTTSATSFTLNVNGLGDVAIRRKLSSGTATLTNGSITTQLYANRPTLLVYDTAMPTGTPYWIAMEFTKPVASDLYGKVPVQNGGWYSNANTTDDDLIEAREAFGVYSKADHDWIQIYDSGEITEQINSFANINISGYKKLMMAIKCVNDTTNASTTRYGSAIFKATNGTTYQFPVFNSMFFGSETTTASLGFFEFTDGWIVCPQVVRSIKYADFLTSTEGGTCTNLNNMGGGLMKCTNTLSTVTISNLDQDAEFFFGVGSRVIIWGCMA